MIFPEFENFLNALSLLFVTDENTWSMANRLGIRFDTLPLCIGTEIAAKAQKHSSFALANHECKGETALLERFVQSVQIVPTNEIAFQEKFNYLRKANKIFELCKKGMEKPDEAIQDIKNFQDEFCSDVTLGSFADVVKLSLYEWKERTERNEGVVKIQNFEKLSEMIGGFNPGRIALLMADTGFGKTNLGLALALNARFTMPTVYFNMEMGFDDIAKRIAIHESQIEYRDFFSKVTDANWIESFKNEGKGFFITDGKTLSLSQIKSAIRMKAKESQIGFVVIDYDQCLELPTSRDMPEWKALQLAFSDLDNFAKEQNCFILILAQLNRDGEISASHRSTFKAHTVLHFKADEANGTVIHAVKNRHGKSQAALVVNYADNNSSIKELEVITLKKQKRVKKEIEVKKQFESSKPVPYYLND